MQLEVMRPVVKGQELQKGHFVLTRVHSTKAVMRMGRCWRGVNGLKRRLVDFEWCLTDLMLVVDTVPSPPQS